MEIGDLGFTYNQAGRPTLDNVNLAVNPGEFLLLAGESGSGKTSLLRVASGLVPHYFGGTISGRVTVDGRDMLETGPGELAASVGYVAQDPETQIVSTTVAAELDLPLEFRGIHPAVRARAVEEVALALNIGHLLDRSVNDLSGGETQRVALAVALVTRPPLVLLDEPTSQLDPVAGDELLWLLRRLNREWGVAVIVAEHRIERCLPISDRVVAMMDGRIGFDGSPRGFLGFAEASGPGFSTPLARLFTGAGLAPPPVDVREAKMRLHELGLAGDEAGHHSFGEAPAPVGRKGRRGRRAGPESALSADSLWVELDLGEGQVDVLRGINLRIEPGERVALMGRNGAGKSTLLRAAAGLIEPVKGRIETPGEMALLTQNPGDFLVRDRVEDEFSGPDGKAALDAVSLSIDLSADPRDLSGGERQRLALAITLAGRMKGETLPGLVALDEPTRGMDSSLKRSLADLGSDLAGRGAAVLIATHDVEFAASFADRVILLGDGVLIADAPTGLILSGGWYFATETARTLDRPGVITVEDGIEWLRGEAGDRSP
ncbi:MAG: ATP-binding cassette domain-containing protein [Solirubrobacterales bacterium]|nr:ATP-binding cassette domain-containing protein [Solirubrobacterales bacterium]